MTDVKSIEIVVDGIEVLLRIRKATIGDDMRRAVLTTQASENPQEDAIDQLSAILLYPRCVACLVEGKIGEKDARKLSAREFIDLPREVGEAWMEAVIELNPGWQIGAAEESASAKKKD